jgi:hypothetical protein
MHGIRRLAQSCTAMKAAWLWHAISQPPAGNVPARPTPYCLASNLVQKCTLACTNARHAIKLAHSAKSVARAMPWPAGSRVHPGCRSHPVTGTTQAAVHTQSRGLRAASRNSASGVSGLGWWSYLQLAATHRSRAGSKRFSTPGSGANCHILWRRSLASMMLAKPKTARSTASNEVPMSRTLHAQ